MRLAHPLSRFPLSVLFAGLPGAMALGCSGRSDGGAAEDATQPADTAGCASIPSADLPAGTSAVTGRVTAANLSAVFCPGGTYARVLSAGATYDTSPYFFELSSDPIASDFGFQSPSGANDGDVSIEIGLPTLSPGTYSGSVAPACGSVAFSYSLPVPSSVACSGGTDTECPTGCGRACPAFGCQGIPCEPQAPTVSYAANGASDCMGNATPPAGSWTLTLSSIADADGGTSKYDELFTPHGSLTMSMPGGAGGTDVARLSASF